MRVLCCFFLLTVNAAFSQDLRDTLVEPERWLHYQEAENVFVAKLIRTDSSIVEEFRFDSSGTVERISRLYAGQKPLLVKEWNVTTGRMETAMFFITGGVALYEELPADSFDAKHEEYFEAGTVAASGYQRKVPILRVRWINDTAVSSAKDTTGYSYETKVGHWNYYYAGGTDSAMGNYAYCCFEHDTVLPDEGPYVVVGWEFHTDIKDGEWRYYSPEGKLLYTEEWENGNLLHRTEHP